MNIAIVIAAAAVAALFVGFTGGFLPETVASSFDFSGAAKGRASREAYLTQMILVVALLPVFVGLVGRFLGSIPDSLINVPNKAYWLAPGRREAALGDVATRMTWLAVGLAIFLCYVHGLVVLAHAVDPPRLDNALLWTGIGAFGAALVGWMVLLHRRFHHP